MASRDEGRSKPYKFLDSYGPDDRDIFVARDRETETLVEDVISSRLVVLFAKTGTGKTSLINAGVRPELEELDYETFWVRVEHDPVDAVRGVLREGRVLGRKAAAKPLPDALRLAAKRLRKPVVIFFDQFEEFFIQFGAPEHADRVGAFIRDVASLYRARDSGIHVVFSMREEYFVEMDIFREEIPSIFHNESSLRLRPFTRAQALEAVVLPAKRRGVKLDKELPDRIVDELTVGGLVEPARLSIVCDTLWQAGHGRAMRIGDFERHGGAEAIVSQRLEQDIAGLSGEHLAVLGQVLPNLRTEYGTKYLRGVDELARSIGVDRNQLDSLFRELKNAHLLHELVIDRARYVEWVSDYVAARTDALSRRARTVLDRRLLDSAITRAAASGRSGETLYQVLPLPAVEIERLAGDPAGLELDEQEAGRLLATAITRGVMMREWWDEAVARSVDVWRLMRDILRDRRVTETVENALELLVEVGDGEAVTVLQERVGEPGLTPAILEALGRLRSDRAAEALAGALADAAQAPPAIDALRRMGTSRAIAILADAMRRGGAVGLRAGTALDTLAGEPDTLERANEARAALDQVLDERAAFLFDEALRHGVPPRFWFDRAKERGIDVWARLRVSVTDPSVPVEQAESAVVLLHELDEPAAVDLLALAAAQSKLRERAEGALEAKGALKQVQQAREDAVARGRARRIAGGGLKPFHWDLLLKQISRGRCVPIVGPGTTADVLPLGSELAQRLAVRYELPLDDPSDLARVAEYLEVVTDRMVPREQLAEIVRSGFPDPSDRDEPHAVLATLPLPIYISANFDSLLETALAGQGRSPYVESVGTGTGQLVREIEPDFDPTVESPLALHLYGHASQPESLVLTQDDFLEFTVTVAAERSFNRRVLGALADATTLAIGFSPAGLQWRVFRHTVLGRLPAYSGRRAFMVALPPPSDFERRLVEQQLERSGFVIYWGTAHDFAAELGERWRTGGA